MRSAPIAVGELVFNTAMSGYQEVITDPSYAGQVIAFTSTHIGNYGTNAADDEAAVPRCRGIVVCDLAAEPSNWRVDGGPGAVPAPPRRAGPHRRGHPTADPARARRGRGALRVRHRARGRAARRRRVGHGTDGLDLVSGVTATEVRVHPGTGPGADSGLRIVAYDFGVKATMVRLLDHPRHGHRGACGHDGRRGARARARRRLPLQRARRPGRPGWPDGRRGRPGGPGARLRHLPRPPDPGHRARRRRPTSCPSATTAPTTRSSVSRPASSRSRARTTTTPSRQAPSPTRETTHVNLNDGVIEGFRSLRAPAFSVQYHPEAAPGPHDARYLFDDFRDLMLAHPCAPPAPGRAERAGLGDRHRAAPRRPRSRSSSSGRARS